MRVHVLIGSMLVVASLAAEAGEPIVVLEYGQRGGSHEYGDDTSTHPFRDGSELSAVTQGDA